MTSKIKELANKAGYNDLIYEISREGLDKFAKLIVAEMLQTCEDHPAWTGRMIGEQIKQHFGVEDV